MNKLNIPLRLVVIITNIIMLHIYTYSISAKEIVYSSSAEIKMEIQDVGFDPRPTVLKRYLERHNSPLAEYSEDLVKYADENELDWRLVASISGVESTFGKRIPINSYNAYGWANGKYYFKSWQDSIEYVSKYLKNNYVDDGLTSVDEIGRRYATSPDWSWKVKFFQNEIEPLPLQFTL